MLFNSYLYIFLFLPLAFAIYFFLQSRSNGRFATVFLVAASLFFYSWWNPIYLPLILGSIFFNYLIGSTLQKQAEKGSTSRPLLWFGVTSNLLLLGYFKYADFFIENVNGLVGTEWPALKLALPLAISFFTFQQIAYLIDCKKNEVDHRGFWNYAAFVSFFPQLIAGPIVHNQEMMPQFASESARKLDYDNVAAGIFVFAVGLFKKVVIADTFAIWANAGFSTNADLQLVEAWVTSLSYTFQLYFDFSGYTDMAIGSALLFNIKLPINFNSPYKSLDLQDFWRRWHITLSRFLRDYLYIPLGGNRKGEARTLTNLLVTFLLGGLWHGAGWTFVFWGFLHGAGLCVLRGWKNAGLRMWGWLAWLITFNYVIVGWVFFRAETWADATRVLRGMCGLNGIKLPEAIIRRADWLTSFGVEGGNTFLITNGDIYTILWIAVGLIGVVTLKNSNQLKDSFRPSAYTLVATVALLVVAVLKMSRISEFLYFNF